MSELADLEQLVRPTTPAHRGGFDTYQEQARARSNGIRSQQKMGHPTRADARLKDFS